MSNPFSDKTPPAKRKEDYDDYALSPPKLPPKDRRTFDEAVRAIGNDFRSELRVEWELPEKQKVVWYKKHDDGSEVELPSDFRRILLFLYSRNFKKHVNMNMRRAAVKDMMRRDVRRVILQVVKCTGDHDLAAEETYRAHYIRACLTIHRYFQQTGATGFVADMSSVKYYLRMQKFGSCFLQAACVAMSYLLHTHGNPVPPPNASRLIRHNFDDEQLVKYVGDNGGDSVGIFKILEKKFFTCELSCRDPTPILCSSLKNGSQYKAATEWISQGPGLVSKFVIPENFICSPPSSDLKQQFPELAPYEDWNDIPAHLLPSGVARFTTWNEPADFIPLNPCSETELESGLIEQWERLLLQSSEDDGGSTSITASMSVDSSSCLADNGSLGTPGERSSTNNYPAFTFMDSDSDEVDWSHFLGGGDDEEEDDDDDDNGCDDDYSASYEDHEPGEGADETPLHAMVLLGHRVVDGSGYWIMQNSWEGPMQILEFSSACLIKSGAYFYFYPKDESRNLKPENEWNIRSSTSFFCPSPVAESSPLERSDCENWSDSLVHSDLRIPDNDDVFDDL